LKKILIFTDSRGQHVPSGSNHKVFAERIRDEVKDVEVDLVLCPMKWTTTIDFFIYIKEFDIQTYDWIILYTGIVEWSPRPIESAISDIYDNKLNEKIVNWKENTQQYVKKVANNKKNTFDEMFGEMNMKSYLNNPFDIKYNGSKTINMVSIKMVDEVLGPQLAEIDNLIFINANRIVEKWNGDYPKLRPLNISLIHKYSDCISKHFPKDRIVDLSLWSEEEINTYTCDNMHLTKAGNEYIFEEIVEKLDLKVLSYFENVVSHDFDQLLKFSKLDKLSENTKKGFLKQYTNNNYLATLIIGIQLKENDSYRIENLNFLLKWINHYYSTIFEILIVEQDTESRFDKNLIKKYQNIRYELIYNNREYNRGWGYNVAVKHFCKNSKVVVLMDTDVLTGSNFLSDVRDCFIGKYKVISPYQNIYYTSPKEAEKIKSEMYFQFLNDKTSIKNPVTLTGGIVILDRATYLQYYGFEQYIGYGCEDRALDAMLLEFCNEKDIKISNHVYPHLYHPGDKAAKKNFKKIYSHLIENYQCEWTDKLLKTDFIHKYCSHSDRGKLRSLLEKKKNSFGNINLYKYTHISINGQIEDKDEEVIMETLSGALSNINNLIRKGNISEANAKAEEALINAKGNDFYTYLFTMKVKELNSKNNSSTVIDGKMNKGSDTLVILGNGPSLKYLDFNVLKNVHTFGLNSAYRFYKEMEFYPTYFGCFDRLVTSNHRESFQELLNDENIPIRKFFFIQNFDDPLKKLNFVEFNAGLFKDQKKREYLAKSLDDFWIYENSGASALHAALAMGYKKVILLGVDASYVQVVEGAKTLEKSNELIIEQTPSKNPNYWRDDYQVKGDVYHVPDAHKYQIPEWERLARNLDKDDNYSDVDVVNCSNATKLDCFRCALLIDELEINEMSLLENTTFLIKAFGRIEYINKLVSSILYKYSNAKILILDDSGKLSEKDISTFKSKKVDLILSSIEDIGLSAGRNQLVENCSTRYMVLLDEDFVFTKRTDIIKALKILATTSIDIVGGAVYDVGPNAQQHNQPRSFHGTLNLDAGGVLIIDESNIEKKSVEGIDLYDLVMNFFIAKTESISKVKWDPELKLAEHLDFFLRAKQSELNITFESDIEVKHIQNVNNQDSEYSEYRARANQYNEIFKKKHKIREIRKNGESIKG